MIDGLWIEGFKSIRKMKLDLKPLNILIGSNGSGKSNFISVFNLLSELMEGNLQRFVGRSGGPDRILYFGRKTTDKLDVWIGTEDLTYTCELTPTKANTLIFAKEYCTKKFASNKRMTINMNIPGGNLETGLNEKTGMPGDAGMCAVEVMRQLKSLKSYHLHDTSDSAKLKQPGEVNDNAFLRPDASNLAAFLYRLKMNYPDHYRTIVETIQMVSPFFDDFILVPSALNPQFIQLEWRHKDSDAYFNAYSLSDGTLRFICLATILLQPEPPSVILLDEPELGLHPYAVTLLASMLESASTRTQVIAATQSVTLVNQFGPENIIVIDREDNQSVFRHLDKDDMSEWLDNYGVGDLWEKNIIGGRPR